MSRDMFRGWPTCARCKKPVDRATVTDDMPALVVRIAAECHGAVDVTTISMFEICKSKRIELKTAFAEGA